MMEPEPRSSCGQARQKGNQRIDRLWSSQRFSLFVSRKKRASRKERLNIVRYTFGHLVKVVLVHVAGKIAGRKEKAKDRWLNVPTARYPAPFFSAGYEAPSKQANEKFAALGFDASKELKRFF
jgi:hypothetical protein